MLFMDVEHKNACGVRCNGMRELALVKMEWAAKHNDELQAIVGFDVKSHVDHIDCDFFLCRSLWKIKMVRKRGSDKITVMNIN